MNLDSALSTRDILNRILFLWLNNPSSSLKYNIYWERVKTKLKYRKKNGVYLAENIRKVFISLWKYIYSGGQ